MGSSLTRGLPLRARLLAGGAVVTTSALMLLQQSQTGVGHDLVSFVAPIDGFLDGYSTIYGSFFNDTPPGVHAVLLPWIWLFTSHPWSMWVLHTFLIVLHQTILFRNLLFHARFTISLAIFSTVSFIAVQQRVFGEMLLNTELLGNVLLFLSFWVYSKFAAAAPLHRSRACVASIALLTLAFWVREVYVFAIVAAILVIARTELRNQQNLQRWFKIVSWSALLGTAPVALFLLFTEGIKPYLFVLKFKRSLYPLPGAADILLEPLHLAGRFAALMGLPAALTLGLMLVVGCWSAEHRNFTLSAIGLVLVSAFAFAWQGKDPINHYLAALLPSIAFVLLAVGRVLVSFKGPKCVPLCLGLVLFAPTSLFPLDESNPLTGVKTPAAWWSEVGSEVGSQEEPTLTVSTRDVDCLQQAYGWAAGTSYRLNKLPPCSKYFLPNLIVDSTFHQLQFKLELLQRPPSIVLYDGGPDADLDVSLFEQTVMPWQSVLQSCYRNTTRVTEFVARMTRTELRECLTKELADQIFVNLRRLQNTKEPWQNLLTPP